MTTRVAIAVICALAAAGPAVARDSGRSLTGYSVTTWSEWNGMPLGTIYTLAQDREGYLWLGGPNGLLRFDGARFSDPGALGLSPLPASAVMALHVSPRDGALWIGFGGGNGVRIIRDGRVATLTPETTLAASATDLREDRSGAIWAATDRGLFRWRGRWQEIPVAGGVRGQQVLRVHVGHDGTIRIGTQTGLQQLDEHGAFHAIGAEDVPVMGISDDAQGRLWVTDPARGFRAFDSLRPAAPGLEGRGFYMLRDSHENLWVGTLGQGVWRIYENVMGGASVVEVATAKNDTLADGVWTAIEDREGNIWLATNRGLARLSRHTMTPLVDYGLVRTVAAGDRGDIWIGTAGGLMRLGGGPAPSARRVAGLDGSDATSLDLDHTGAMFVAAGQTVWRIVGGHLRRVAIVSGRRPIRAIAGDGAGGVWVVDGEGRLLRAVGGRPEAAPIGAGTERSSISFVHMDRQERLWIAFEDGALGIMSRDGTLRLFGAADGWMAHTEINTITEGRDGVLWIGTSSGLTRYRGGRFATLTGASSFSGKTVRALIGDDLGYVWLGIGGSLARLDPAAFEAALERPNQSVPMRRFDVTDGVAGVIFEVGNGGAARAADGRLFFVTGRGVTTVDPQVVDDRLRPPQSPVRIDGVVADDQRFHAGDGLSLPAGTAHLRIDYAMPTLTSLPRTRFRYRLVGIDRDWIDAGIKRQALYTDLPAGNYQFVVQAQIPEGAWTSRATVWAFDIAPWFYQTAWFYASCVGALAMMAGVAWQLRIRTVRRELAAVYGERMRLGREIHDTLLQSLAGLALQLDTVEQHLIPADSGAASKIGRIRSQMEDHVREVRQSIWDLRSPDARPRSLAEELSEGVRRLVPDGVALQLDVAGSPHACPDDVAQQVLRIAREAVINAVQHGKARRVALKLAFDRRALRLTVTDDGCGFDPAAVGRLADTHYGLTAMKERAAAMGGSCSVTSRPGGGTNVSIELPVRSRWSMQRGA